MITWAKQNFPEGFVVKRFDFWLFIIILVSPLFGCALISVINGILRPDGMLLCVGIVLVAAWGGLINYSFGLRRRTVVYIDSNGVKTRAGKFHQWADLSFIYLAPVAALTPSGNPGVSKERYRMELNFEDGKAVVPELPEITKLLEDAPIEVVDRRGRVWG